MPHLADHSSSSSSQANSLSSAQRDAETALHLRTADPADGEAIHALLVANMPGILANRDRWLRRWHWQRWDNPYRCNRPTGWVLTQDDRIVGHLGAVYLPLRIGSVRQIGVVVTDYVVDQTAIARKGLFAGLELAQAFFDSAGNTLYPMATTANEKTGAVFGRFGCQAVPWTKELWRAPTTPAQQIRTLYGANHRVARRLLNTSVGAFMAKLLGRYYQTVRHRLSVPIPHGDWLETTVPQLAWDLGTLFERIYETRTTDATEESTMALSFGIDRTADYLYWRYGQHPECDNIRVLMIRDNEGHPIGGAVVFCEDRQTQRLAFVEDLIVLPDRPDVVRSLLCAALMLAADHHADYLITTTGRYELRPLFWELGFESRARSAPAAVIRDEQKSESDLPATSSHTPLSLDDRLELWHGAMF